MHVATLVEPMHGPANESSRAAPYFVVPSVWSVPEVHGKAFDAHMVQPRLPHHQLCGREIADFGRIDFQLGHGRV